MHPSHRAMTVIAALIVAAGSLAAQSAGATDQQSAASTPAAAPPAVSTPTGDATVSSAPLAENASVGIHLQPANAPAPYVPMRRDEPVGHNAMLMIVGGAILVTGAIIAGSASNSGARSVGDIAMIGGAVVGIIGLVRYLH
jgi:hypothetical protein